MPHKEILRTLSALAILSLVLSACSLSGNSSAPVTGSNAQSLTATLNEISGSVEVKQTSESAFASAADGLVLQTGGELRTGDDGRARLDLSDGTLLRVGPSSAFALQALDSDADGTKTSLRLDQGQIWIILNSGALQVETSSGVASVRGSYLSVLKQPDGAVKITCLEGDCGLENGAGDVNLVAGQSAFVSDADTPPEKDVMTEAEFNEWLRVNPEASIIIPAVTATQGALQPAATPTQQPFATPAAFGPNAEDFPPDYNPLTGQPAADIAALDLPALLISVSNFPPIARPQAGLSFAPYVFEISITEGATRFLSAFYGEFPHPEIPIDGGCEVRTELFVQTDTIIGNRVWLDENGDGIQNNSEPGVGGVCVNLYDEDGELRYETTTDSNGYYGFNVQPASYTVGFVLPAGMQFTGQNVGDESHDSDADQVTGRAEAAILSDTQPDVLYVDAGLGALPGVTPTPNPTTKAIDGEVGPVRSGRLIYADVAGFFQDSCLVYAFASEEVLAQLPQCAMVAHEDNGGGSMLDITRMRAIAEENEKADTLFNYASNKYSDVAPAGGIEANQLNVFFANLNQSGWTYDPLYESYLRFTDNAKEETAGLLHPDVDRLTGRQLHFENVIVLFTDHDVISPTNLDIHLEQGAEGPATLFRDGLAYQIRWSTRSGDYEKETGRRRPIQWLDITGDNPFPLKPGHTWVIVVTPFSELKGDAGVWRIRFYPPPGSAGS
jgi:hypothetical protein